MTGRKRPSYGICDSKGRVIERYSTRYFAERAAITWATCKGASVTIRLGRRIIGAARPDGNGRVCLDEGHMKELAL